jgi:CsoR family transcriptional regulator, copper-sensing transcriptional repressor
VFSEYAIYSFLPPRIVDMSSHKRSEVTKRMARIHGHVHGIMAMLEEGRSYSEIVQQISAVKSGLDSAVQVIVDDLVEDCVAKKSTRNEVAQSILELRQVIARSR